MGGVATMSRVNIVCCACGAETSLKRSPRYDGFVRIGEQLTCAACGHEYATENDVPFKQRHVPNVFLGLDIPDRPKIFDESDKGRLCLHCSNYVVNPFTQKCGLHFRTVEATDCCADFKSRDAAPKQD